MVLSPLANFLQILQSLLIFSVYSESMESILGVWQTNLKRILASGLMGAGLLGVALVAAQEERSGLGGEHTAFDESAEAFTNHLNGLSEAQLAQFDEGDELFEQEFVAGSGDPTATNDGLGPIFNAVACETCHKEDGRGRPPEFDGETQTGFLIRLARSERNLNGGTMPDPIYGGQF